MRNRQPYIQLEFSHQSIDNMPYPADCNRSNNSSSTPSLGEHQLLHPLDTGVIIRNTLPEDITRSH
jgi:hypothetical protein